MRRGPFVSQPATASSSPPPPSPIRRNVCFCLVYMCHRIPHALPPRVIQKGRSPAPSTRSTACPTPRPARDLAPADNVPPGLVRSWTQGGARACVSLQRQPSHSYRTSKPVQPQGAVSTQPRVNPPCPVHTHIHTPLYGCSVAWRSWGNDSWPVTTSSGLLFRRPHPGVLWLRLTGSVSHGIISPGKSSDVTPVLGETTLWNHLRDTILRNAVMV